MCNKKKIAFGFVVLGHICITTKIEPLLTVVSVAKPWLICGYHGLTTVTMFLFCLICSKTMVHLWLPWFNYSNHVFVCLICSKTMVNLWLPWFNYSNHVFV